MAYSIQVNDLRIKPKYQPVVKFQNIDKNVLHAVQSGDSTATNKLEADGGLERNDNNEQEEVMDTDNVQSVQPIVFEIDPNIDIDSLALKEWFQQILWISTAICPPKSHGYLKQGARLELVVFGGVLQCCSLLLAIIYDFSPPF